MTIKTKELSEVTPRALFLLWENNYRTRVSIRVPSMPQRETVPSSHIIYVGGFPPLGRETEPGFKYT